jgi:outer membrane protein, multidrug efflux system
MSRMRKQIWTLIFLLLSGCTVGPNYCPPPIDVPCSWRVPVEETSALTNTLWWRQFDDPVLTELIATALRRNQNLLEATYRVEEFLGLYRTTRSSLFPQIYGQADYTRQKTSDLVVPPAPGIKNPDDIYRFFLTGSWELDLWGKLRRATEAACADLLATEEARLTVVQTLVTGVAFAYIDLLRLDEQLLIAIKTAAARRQTLDLFQKRFDAGVISKIDLSQIESEYQEAVAIIPDFEQRVARVENALSVLIGRNPGKIPRGNTMDTLTMPQIPSGLPSELLVQRPDIRAAENALMAATARIGVARAAYFPSVTLTGDYGSASRELSDLFKGDANFWNYFIPVTVPIFTGGRIAGEVKAAEAVRCQTLAAYRQQILEAFQEVDDALVVYQKRKEQVEAQGKQVEALQTYARLARMRYDEGYASYLEVLDAERTLFNVQLSYSETYANMFQAMVAIYKALGGGWICEADSLTGCSCY